MGMVIPHNDRRNHAAVLVSARGFALPDQPLECVAAARQNGVRWRQRQRGAQVVRAITAVDDALVRVLPPQALQLLTLRRNIHRRVSRRLPKSMAADALELLMFA